MKHEQNKIPYTIWKNSSHCCLKFRYLFFKANLCSICSCHRKILLFSSDESVSKYCHVESIMWSFLKGFENLTSEDKTALRKGSKLEVMFLHAAQLYSQKEWFSSASESKKRPINSILMLIIIIKFSNKLYNIELLFLIS